MGSGGVGSGEVGWGESLNVWQKRKKRREDEEVKVKINLSSPSPPRLQSTTPRSHWGQKETST